MRLISLLNHDQHFPGFVYEQARHCAPSQTIEISVRPRRGSRPVCSGCHKPSPTDDHLKPRRFEFVPLWGCMVVLLYCMRRVDCRDCGVRVEAAPWGIGKRFFDLIGEALAGQIEFVCSDMWQPYLKVIGARCSQAIHILDRFHIGAKMNAALDQVRAAEARRLAQDGYEPVLQKTRWCVLKRKANLTGQQRFRLRDLLRYNLRTVRAYPLKEDFQQLWEYEAPNWAGKFLDAWCCQVMRSRIEPMKKIARTLRSHRALILNYFRARKQLSSGVVEGLNNKAKLTMRKSYGFRTFHVTEIALYHALGKLPEPDVAHRFF